MCDSFAGSIQSKYNLALILVLTRRWFNLWSSWEKIAFLLFYRHVIAPLLRCRRSVPEDWDRNVDFFWLLVSFSICCFYSCSFIKSVVSIMRWDFIGVNSPVPSLWFLLLDQQKSGAALEPGFQAQFFGDGNRNNDSRLSATGSDQHWNRISERGNSESTHRLSNFDNHLITWYQVIRLSNGFYIVYWFIYMYITKKI